MHPAAGFGLAAACLLAAAACHGRRDAVLRLATWLRGYRSSGRGVPPGPRRRYQQSRLARLDMLAPVLLFVTASLVFLANALLTLSRSER